MSRRQVRGAPVSVTVAGLALLVAAAGIAVDSVIGLVLAEPVTDAFRRAYAGVDGVDFSEASIRANGTILLIAAAGLVLLAWFNRRGSRAARVHTWLLGVLVLCWGGSSLLGERRVPQRVPDPAELERLLAEAMPGWVEPVTTGTVLVAVVAVAVAMVLLALPASNQFFRRADQPPLTAADLPAG